MKAFIKIFFLIIALTSIFIGFDKISHTYEISEQRYKEYIHDLPVKEHVIQIPETAKEYYISTNIKEIIVINFGVMFFGIILLLILIVDFIKWVNTWEKDEEV